MNTAKVEIPWLDYENNAQLFVTDIVEVTVREVFEALKKNGFDHLRETWTSVNADGKFVGGCALGQAALNLNVAHSSDAIVIDRPDNSTYELTDILNTYNILDQLNTIDVPVDSTWYIGSELGGTIVFWNDHKIEEYDEIENYTGWKWALETYDDVVKMAYELMEPHLDKVLQVLPYQFEKANAA